MVLPIIKNIHGFPGRYVGLLINTLQRFSVTTAVPMPLPLASAALTQTVNSNNRNPATTEIRKRIPRLELKDRA